MFKENSFYLYSYVIELFILLCIICYISYKTKHITILCGIIVILIIFCFFYRNNLEPIERNKNTFLSPSSSKIVAINKKNNLQVINTYLSPLDRHFMIAPCDCTVIEKIYQPQRKTDSECMRHIFEDTYGNKFYLDQIVSKPLHWGWLPSILYDRCVSFVEIGQKLKQGERFGMIRFGSNMEYGIPLAYVLDINEDEHFDMGEKMGIV